MRRDRRAGTLEYVSDPLVERDEIVGLLFNVSDINATLVSIERLLKGEDDEAEEDE